MLVLCVVCCVKALLPSAGLLVLTLVRVVVLW
jgi:hypothetical protein